MPSRRIAAGGITCCCWAGSRCVCPCPAAARERRRKKSLGESRRIGIIPPVRFDEGGRSSNCAAATSTLRNNPVVGSRHKINHRLSSGARKPYFHYPRKVSRTQYRPGCPRLLVANGVVYYAMHQQNVWLEGDYSWRSDTFVLGHRWTLPIASAAFITLAVVVVALANTAFLLYFTSRGKPLGDWLPGCITGIVSAIISIMLFS